MARRAPSEKGASPKPRALWKGALVLGLVSIPVSLHRAVRKRGLSFHDLHDQDGGRIQRRSVCSIDGAPVSHAHVVKGFEVEPGRFVTLTHEEIHALDPAASRAIEIVEFVDPHEIDPVYFGRTYWLVPSEEAERAYGLLAAAMSSLLRVAISRLTLRGQQHLAAVRPVTQDDKHILALSTLGYADEILPVPWAGLPAEAPGDRELALAERLVESLSGPFRPQRYHDEHRARVLAFLKSKAEGAPPAEEPVPAAPPPEPTDLFGALEASLAEAERHRSAA